VREALRETALNHASPDNNIGWGLVQGLAARDWVPSSTDAPAPAPTGIAFAIQPNPFVSGSATTLRFRAPGYVRIAAYDLRGRRVAELYEGPGDETRTIHWSGTDAAGQRLRAGLYWLRIEGASVRRSLRAVLLP